MLSTYLREIKWVVRTLLLTYPCCEYGSSRYGNRATIPCAYITLTFFGGDVLMYEFNGDNHSMGHNQKQSKQSNTNNVSLEPTCMILTLSSKYIYHLSSGGIFQGFGFCIFLHDVFTARLCCEDFFNQLKWKQNIQSEMFEPYIKWGNDNRKTLHIKSKNVHYPPLWLHSLCGMAF